MLHPVSTSARVVCPERTTAIVGRQSGFGGSTQLVAAGSEHEAKIMTVAHVLARDRSRWGRYGDLAERSEVCAASKGRQRI